jgi:hypothetical protein
VQFQLAYLQIHSHFSPFGGVSKIESLAETLENLNPEADLPVAAALTDTFSLAGFPLWHRLLAGTSITPLAGAEVGITFGERGLPFSLLLLAESQEGYANLCRLLSAGLTGAGAAPLTARVELELLAAHTRGLIALAPYTGGPVTAALLSGKSTEARNRAATLKDLFGPGSFFVGAPPLVAQAQPQTIDRINLQRGFDPIKINAALVKLCRDLKVGLIGTGEARFARPDEAANFTPVHNRLQKALTGQYTPQQLQQNQASADWLYSPRPGWPVADLYLRPVAELVAHYNEADWPGALTGNQLVAGRCAAWKPLESQAITRLRELAGENLAKVAGTDETKLARLRQRIENELTEIDRLGLGDALLAAGQLENPAQIILARRLNSSVVAALLGLTGSGLPPEDAENHSPFEAYDNGRPLRLEVGPRGREILLDRLNREDLHAAPLVIPTEPGEVPILHSRLIVYSPDRPLSDLAVLQPALTPRILSEGIQGGPLDPLGTSRFEVNESPGLGHLQCALTILNRWQGSAGKTLTGVRDLTVPPLSKDNLDSLEKQRVLKQLEWFRLENPAAYFAAALSLAAEDKVRLNSLAQAIRLAELSLLPPDIQTGQVEASLEGEDKTMVRVGLGRALDPATARQIVASRPPGGFNGLDELVKNNPLTAEQVRKLAWTGAFDAFGRREQVAEAAPRIEKAGQTWREWQQYQDGLAAREEEQAIEEKSPPSDDLFGGQMSLFDMVFEVEPAAAVPAIQEPEQIKLVDVPPLTPLERLRRAYAALGFYTSEHPLWKQPAFLNADTNRDLPLTIAEALAQTGDQPVLITGMIAALRRIPVKVGANGSEGEELVVLNIEDFSGQAQLMVSNKIPLGGLELQEGKTLAARVQPLPDQKKVLAAIALAPFPPQPGDPVAFPPEEVLELETGNPPDPATVAANEPPSDPGSYEPPPEDGGWSNSLFASMGIPEPEPLKPATPPPAPNNNRGRNGNGNGKAAAPARPVPKYRRVHIRLPKDFELDLMDQLKEVLRSHPGEDAIIIYLPLPDGGVHRIEPQSLQVAYGPPLVNDISALIGPGGIELEER